MEGCLQQGVDTQITNTSFRLHKGSIHTVQQSKSAFNQVYVKRQVQADGVSTRPLDMVLRPFKKHSRGVTLDVEDDIPQPARLIDGEGGINVAEDEARVRVELGMGELGDYGIAEEPEPRGIDV